MKKYFIAYGLIVVISALVYWFIFSCNTTSFVISEQLNKRVDRYDFLDTLDLAKFRDNSKDEVLLTINNFYLFIKPSFDTLDFINNMLKFNHKAIEKCELKQDSIYQIIEKTRSGAIEEYKDKSLNAMQNRIDSLKCEMQGKDTTELVLSGEYLKLAMMELEYAERNKEVQDNIIKHYGSFVPVDLSEEYQQMYNYMIKLMIDRQNLERNRINVSADIKEKVRLFHENRRETVGLFDFLYYSVCVSTTTSFGDIVPNNTLTRTISLLELLACVFWVGMMINKISKRLDEKRG